MEINIELKYFEKYNGKFVKFLIWVRLILIFYYCMILIVDFLEFFFKVCWESMLLLFICFCYKFVLDFGKYVFWI